MSEPLKICIQRATTRREWDAMQDDYINRAVAAADRIEKLEAALQKVMIGGNHVALLIGVGPPPHTSTHEKALMHYNGGDAYEAWCCWKTIMEARKALEGKDE